MEREKVLWHEFVLAASATSCAAVFTNPLEVVKTRLQLQNELIRSAAATRIYRNPMQAFVLIARTEGLRGLQTGLMTSMGYQIAIGGTRFSLFEPLKNALGVSDDDSQRNTVLNFTKTFAAGLGSGVIASFFGNPFYLMKTRLQAANSATSLRGRHSYSSGYEGFKSIWRHDGISGYWRGIGGAVPRVAFGSATQIVSYDYFKRLLVRHNVVASENTITLQFIASLLSGLVNVTAMNPFDVISVRLYNQPTTALLYNGPIDCFIKTIVSEGPKGLLKGWVAQYVRLGPHTVLTFLFWEQFRLVYNNKTVF